jgi:cardiolipin synthase
MADGGEFARPIGYGFVTLPNIITFARLCAVPVAVWLVLQEYFATAFWLFAGAGASDAIDGWLARRRGTSYVGALLDPVADKALLMTMYVTLAAVHVLPDWLAILVVFRDAVILGGVVVIALLGQPLMIRPLMISKANTVLQIVLVALALLSAAADVSAPLAMWVLSWAVAASTLSSGAAYVWKVARP